MLMNYKQLEDWLNTNIEGFDFIERKHGFMLDEHTPIRYRDYYTKVGMFSIWNDVGTIELNGYMYKPNEGGTILYEVNI